MMTPHTPELIPLTTHLGSVTESVVPPGMLGNIHSMESGSFVDGPGLRFVVFLAGCPLRCTFCHNPDTWKPCAGQSMTVQQVMQRITPFARFLQVAGGGVTFSGGEPTLQLPFLLELVHECKQAGLHVALESSGYRGRHTPTDLLRNLDLLILDVKSIDPTTYRQLTHVPIQGMLDTAELAAEEKLPLWLSVILIPNQTDSPAHLKQLGQWAASLGNVRKISIKPFHQLGANKWEMLGLDYPMQNVHPPTQDALNDARQILAAASGLDVE